MIDADDEEDNLVVETAALVTVGLSIGGGGLVRNDASTNKLQRSTPITSLRLPRTTDWMILVMIEGQIL